MTRDEMIIMLEHMVGEEDRNVLSAYLSMAGDALVDFIFPYEDDKDVPKRYHNVQVELAAYWLDKRGAEGQTEHSENGVRRTYGSADIPDEMLSRITPYVGVIGG